MKGSRQCFFLLLIWVFSSTISLAQSLTTTTDKRNILIGEQFKYTVVAAFPENRYTVHWLDMPDSFAHFEVINPGKTDTSLDNGIIHYSQVITLTSFDSGRNIIPSFAVRFEPITSDTPNTVLTDTIPIMVSYSPLDSTRTFHTIKTIMDVKDRWPLWKWLALLGLLMTAALIIILLIKYFRTKTGDVSSGKVPFDEAMKALQKLKEQQIIQIDLRQYHTRLTEIFRRYISRKIRTNILNKTSSELILLLRQNHLKEETILNVKAALDVNESVKFAKYKPGQQESELCFEIIQKTIMIINQPTATKDNSDS